MFTLLRNNQRQHVQSGIQDVWHSLGAQDHPDPLSDGFGFLVAFDEMRLPPGQITEPHYDGETEVVTCVYKGALSQEDSAGFSSVIYAGEFQHMSTGCRHWHNEKSVSRSDAVHMFRISLRPSEIGIKRDYEQRRFTAAQRRNLLCVVASPDGRNGSLRIHQDALVYSAVIEPGYHLVHEIKPGRSVWLHVVCGEAILNDIVLTQGDAISVTKATSVSLTIQESTEMLLIDLGPPPQLSTPFP